MSIFESNSRSTIAKLLSGWVMGTQRSSPQKRWMCFHSYWPFHSGVAISEYSDLGVEPPESETAQVPLPKMAFLAMSRNDSAAFTFSAARSSHTTRFPAISVGPWHARKVLAGRANGARY